MVIELFNIKWLDSIGGIDVEVRFEDGRIPYFSQLLLSNGSVDSILPSSFTYALLLRVSIYRDGLPGPDEKANISSVYRDSIPFTYTSPDKGGDGVFRFNIGVIDSNISDWNTQTSIGYMCMRLEGLEGICYYSNIIRTGGIEPGPPTIIGSVRSCEGTTIDYISFSPENLVVAYQITLRGTPWGWVQIENPQYAGQINTMAINPKESDVLLTTRDILGDEYTFNIGYYTNKKAMLWVIPILHGYGGTFYG